jgi:transcriptional regulator with XRE-family HTH domain
LGNLSGGIYALLIMPERSFGRTVRYRRTKLGLSQAKLGELVGRSTATIRSWERDTSRPNDQQVLSALAAVLGVDERQLFEKAEVERPMMEETSPTIEQVLATLAPPVPPAPAQKDTEEETEPSETAQGEEDHQGDHVEQQPPETPNSGEPAERRERQLVGAGAVGPAYVAPPDPYIQTAPTPSLADLSYVEDDSQRQLYRVRNLATVVAVIVLFIAFLWAVGEGLGALGEWWDGFVGQLRL